MCIDMYVSIDYLVQTHFILAHRKTNMDDIQLSWVNFSSKPYQIAVSFDLSEIGAMGTPSEGIVTAPIAV